MSQPTQPAATTSVRHQPIEVYLNSNNGIRLGEYHNRVFFTLPRPIIAPEGCQIYMSCISFTCPVSWYILNSTCDTLYINSVPYVLPWGNYSIVDLVNALRGFLPFVVSYNSINHKITISSSFNIVVSGNMCKLLGIIEGSSGLSVTTAYTVDLSGVNSVFVLSNYTGNNIDSAGPGQCVMCRVPVAVPPLGVIQYEDFAAYAGVMIGDDAISSIEISLEDETRLPLQASIFWEATLQIQFINTGVQRLIVERPIGFQAPPNPQ